MTDLERAQAYFGKDLFATQAAGIRIEQAEPGRAVCVMAVARHHKNALGNVMGGAIFTLADYAFAVASNFDQTPTVSLSSSITFLTVPKGETLRAEATCVRAGRTTCLYQIQVTDGEGRLCAHVTANGYIVG